MSLQLMTTEFAAWLRKWNNQHAGGWPLGGGAGGAVAHTLGDRPRCRLRRRGRRPGAAAAAATAQATQQLPQQLEEHEVHEEKVQHGEPWKWGGKRSSTSKLSLSHVFLELVQPKWHIHGL